MQNFRLSHDYGFRLDASKVVVDRFLKELPGNIGQQECLLEVKEVERLDAPETARYISTLAMFSGDAFYLLDRAKKLIHIKDKEIVFESGFDFKMLFDVVEFFFMRELLFTGKAFFLHASAIKYQGRVKVFCGCNNTGKTKVLLELARRGGEILGDDWVVVEKNGLVSTYSRRVRMYPNDIISSPDLVQGRVKFPFLLRNVFDKRKPFPIRVVQAVYEKQLVMRGVIPVPLAFSEVSGQNDVFISLPVDDLYLYSKWNNSEISCDPISAEDLARKMCFAIENEMQKVPDYQCWRAFGGAVPSNDKGFSIMENILTDFAKNARVKWLSIPFLATFSEVADYVTLEHSRD